MVIRAPIDGIVNILPNFRVRRIVRTGAAAVQGRRPGLDRRGHRGNPRPDRMRIELKLEEVDRGKLQARPEYPDPGGRHPGQGIHRRLDWISPIAALNFRAWAGPERLSRPAPL